MLFLALAVILFYHAAFGQVPTLPPEINATNHIYHAPFHYTHVEIITDPDTNAWNVWEYSTNINGPWLFYTNTPVWQWRIPISSTNQMMFFRQYTAYSWKTTN